MSAWSNSLEDLPLRSQEFPPGTTSATRPFYWSIRRELWENRSLYVGPLAVAVLVLFGFIVSTYGIAERRAAVLQLEPYQQRETIAKPYDVGAMMLMATAFLVGVFYSVDALHADRRDRSILFWKSLPVSDRTTVLSKAAVPFVVLPLLTFVTIVTTQFLMLLWSSLVLLESGLAATTWTRFNFFEQSTITLYGLVVLALWHAPIYGWLLLVSAWAKRATFLWVVLPPFAIGAMERLALGSTHFASFLRYRLMGGTARAFIFETYYIDSLKQLTPGRFLSTPALWGGLIVAALFLAAAVRLRRNRQPI